MARTRPHPGAHSRGRLAHASGVGACSWASAVGTLRDPAWWHRNCWYLLSEVEMVPTRWQTRSPAHVRYVPHPTCVCCLSALTFADDPMHRRCAYG